MAALVHDHAVRVAAIAVEVVAFDVELPPFEGRFACFCIAVIAASFVAEHAMILLAVHAAKHAAGSPVQILAWGQLALRAVGLCGVIAGNAIALTMSMGTREEALPYLGSLEVLLLAFAGSQHYLYQGDAPHQHEHRHNARACAIYSQKASVHER